MKTPPRTFSQHEKAPPPGESNGMNAIDIYSSNSRETSLALRESNGSRT